MERKRYIYVDQWLLRLGTTLRNTISIGGMVVAAAEVNTTAITATATTAATTIYRLIHSSVLLEISSTTSDIK